MVIYILVYSNIYYVFSNIDVDICLNNGKKYTQIYMYCAIWGLLQYNQNRKLFSYLSIIYTCK